MRNYLITISMIMLLSGCGSAPMNHDTVQADSNSLEYSERVGLALYKATRFSAAKSDYTSRELYLMDSSSSLQCEGEYTAVSISDVKSKFENTYLLLLPQADQGIQFGRHIRFRFDQGSNDIVDATTSTKTCILVPVKGDGIPYVTHLLSETPTEFHVFLSLYHETEIYISTSIGLWRVREGKISNVEA